MRSRIARLAAVCGMLGARTALAQLKMAAPAESPSPAIRDIRPPLDVFPYPMWMVVTACALAAVLAGIVAAVIVNMARRRPKPPPPTPREIALQRLKEAEPEAETRQPYAFSILVSDILRQYVSAQYHLHATEQTSPEFLADAARSPHFTAADKRLLAEFLERCDLIKFARMAATVQDSKALLDQAVQFVMGGAAPGP